MSAWASNWGRRPELSPPTREDGVPRNLSERRPCVPDHRGNLGPLAASQGWAQHVPDWRVRRCSFARASGHWPRHRPDCARRFIISGPLLPEGAISRSQRTDPLIVIIVITVIDNLEIWCLDRLLACSDDGDMEHTGPEGGPVEVESTHKIDIESLSHEQRDQLREILLSAKALGIKAV
jgi:hypothetical protein